MRGSARDEGAEVARPLSVAAFLRYNRLRQECASPSAAALPDRPTLVSHRPKSDGHVAMSYLVQETRRFHQNTNFSQLLNSQL